MRQWLLSLREFARALWKGWAFVVVVVICGALGLLQSLTDSGVLPPVARTHVILPAWAWYVASVIGLLAGSFVAFHRMRVERDRLLARATEGSAPNRAEWDREEREFREATAKVWNVLLPLFEEAGFFGDSSARSGFRDTVRLAPWPDDQRERSDASSLSETVLNDFCDRACARSGERLFRLTSEYQAFDAARRDASRILREWAGRRKDVAFTEWLREKLPWPRQTSTSPLPYHAHTVKLVWYLELATARESGNETPDHSFLPALRDALSQQLPLRLGVDADGYLDELPPES